MKKALLRTIAVVCLFAMLFNAAANKTGSFSMGDNNGKTPKAVKDATFRTSSVVTRSGIETRIKTGEAADKNSLPGSIVTGINDKPGFINAPLEETCTGGKMVYTYDPDQKVRHFTVPENVTQLTVKVVGANGGNSISGGQRGGIGYAYEAVISVVQGDKFTVVPGQRGSDENMDFFTASFSGGGGGGSYLFKNNEHGTYFSNNYSLVAVAGGGGGASLESSDIFNHSLEYDIDGAGRTSGYYGAYGNGGGYFGSGGQGGYGGNASGGGGGHSGDGASDPAVASGSRFSTSGFINGAGGVNPYSDFFYPEYGGFGGGGAQMFGGGGGGGYSGGAGGGFGFYGGGGGSYFTSTDVVSVTGFAKDASKGLPSGEGLIEISWTIQKPIISVFGNNNPITNGQTAVSSNDFTDFGEVTVSGSLTHTFVIKNTGTRELSAGAFTVSDPVNFGITYTDPMIAPPAGGTVSFTVTYHPTNPGSHSATVYFLSSDNCEGEYTFKVAGKGVETEAPPLVPGVIGASQTVCAGDPVNPVVNTTGASGGTGAISYQWQSKTGAGTFTDIPGATSQSYSPPVAAVTTSYQRGAYTATDAVVYSNIVTVIVNPLPSVTAGSNSPICAGQTINLTSTSAVSYFWTGPGGFTSNNQNPSIAAAGVAMSGTYVVKIEDVNGCRNTANVTVTVNAKTTPTFTQVAAICSGASLSALPTTSDNGIPGTWYPALNNTATTIYTFTPSAGECANTATMTIVVNPLVAPTFTQVAAICSGASLAALPTTSTNNITGTWSPVLNNTTTTTYTFTPDASQCAATATMTITVNPNPVITGIANVCVGGQTGLATMATTAPSGAWSSSNPSVATVVNGLVTGIYAGTAVIIVTDVNGCSSSVTVTVTALPDMPATSGNVTICSGTSTTLSAFSSLVPQTFRWYTVPTGGTPVFTGGGYTPPNLTSTTTYYVEVNNGPGGVGGCTSARAAVTVTVSPVVTPTFNQVAAICSGASLEALPTTSTNNITGTWSPALNNTATTTYTFTPDAGQCAATTTMTITVNPKPSGFSVGGGGSYCAGGTGVTIYTGGSTAGVNYDLKLNGSVVTTLAGTGSDLYFNNVTAEGIYTVVATNQTTGCTATMPGSATVTINTSVTPTFTQVAAVCSGASLAALPTISNNGIPGAWYPALNNTATTTYTFIPDAGQCATTATMTITVNQPVAPTFTQAAAICYGESPVTLPTISNNGITGTWSLISNTATSTVTFTPQAGQCATTATMTIVVNPLPTIGGTPNVCAGSTTQLTGSGTPAAVNPWTSSDPLKATVSNTGVVTGVAEGAVIITYTNSNGCSQTQTVFVNPTPDIYSVAGSASVCTGASAVVQAFVQTPSPQTIFTWYDAAAGGNVLGTGYTLNIPSLAATITFYVEANYNGCVSARNSRTIIAKPLPVITGISGSLSACQGISNILTASSGAISPVFRWYTVETGGSPIFTGASYNTNALTTTTSLYVSVTSDGCASESRTPVTVTVNPKPPVLNYVSTPNCNGSITVSVTNASGAVVWNPGNIAGNTIAVTQTGVYNATQTVNGCVSPNAPITVTVLTPAAVFAVSGGGNICAEGSGATISLSGSETGVLYTLLHNGNPFISQNGTGEAISFNDINAPGTYTISAQKPGFPPACTVAMNGSANVSVGTAPVIHADFVGGMQGTNPGVCTTVYDLDLTIEPNPLTASVSYTYTGATTGSGSGTGFPGTFNKGTTYITVTVTNSCGSSTLNFVLEVTDTEAPVVPAINTVTAQCDATVTAPVATDNCDGTVTGTTNDPLTYSTPGDHVIHWTFIDANGNTSEAEQHVVIQDITPPAIACPANITVTASTLDINGAGGANVTYTVTAADNCGTPSLTYNISSGSFFAIGSTTVTAVATDAAGLTSTCSFTVTVKCPTPVVEPITGDDKICLNNYETVVANATAGGTWTSSDNGILVVGSNGELYPQTAGTAIITYTVVNEYGCPASVTKTITVNEVPEVEPVTTSNPANRVCVTENITLSSNTPGGVWTSSDTDIAVVNVSTGVVTGRGAGLVTITYTVTNASGCSTSVMQQIVVNALPQPSIVTGPNSVCIGGVISMSIDNPNTNRDDISVWTSSNEAVATVSAYPQGIRVSGLTAGTTVITQFYNDHHTGCAAVIATIPITVTALPQPVITRSGPTSFCTGGSVTLSTAVVDGYSYQWKKDGNDIEGATSSEYIATGSGDYTVTVKSAEGCPGTSEPVAVSLQVAPVFTSCPGNITVDAENCKAYVNYSIGIDGGEPSALVSYTFSGATTGSGGGFGAFSQFNLGVTTVTITAVNSCGTVTCSFTVTVKDVTAPVQPLLPDINAECSATVTAPVTTDDCSGTVTGTTSDALTYNTQGIHTIHWTFTDAAGNRSYADQNVIIKDVTAPVPVCPANITTTANTVVSGTAGAYVTYAATATDNCSIPTLSYSPVSGGFLTVGTHTITVTAVDAAGNTASCTFDVTVNCAPPSVVSCPSNQTVNTDAGVCTAVVNYTSSFNLGLPAANVSYTFSGATTGSGAGTGTGATFNKGTTYVTVTASNLCGTVNCTFAITAEDHQNPTITAPANVTVNVDANSCSATNVDLGTETTGDNCEVASITNNAPSSFPIGTTTVTWTVKDGSGNTSTATQTVTVVDNIKPVVNCPSDIVLTATSTVGSVTGAYATYNVTATDNCGTATVNYSVASGTLFPIGTTIVTVTATDAAGLTSTCDFRVIVNCIPPTVVACSSDKAVNTDPGVCTAAVAYTATFNTGLPAAGITYTFSGATTGNGNGTGSNAIFNKGVTTVTITATNICGTVTCSFKITVTDNEAPVIHNMPVNISKPNDPAACGAVVTWAEPDATDNCPGVIISSNYPSGYLFPVGTTTVIYTATDGSGHTDTESFTVTVTDNTDPIITIPGDITHTSDPGLCSYKFAVAGNGGGGNENPGQGGGPNEGVGAAVLTMATATDNCGVVTVLGERSDNLPLDVPYPVGVTIITWTATDAHGRTSTGTQTITITDDENPVIHGMPADISVSNDANTCGAIVNWTVPTTTDNCAATLKSSHNPGELFPIGNTLVTYTSTDVHGHSVSNSFNVFVSDTEKPTIACPQSITVPATAGENGATVNYSATSNDNCGVGYYTYSIPSGSHFAIGTTPVTVTVADIYGNTAECTFNVTVVNTAPIANPDLKTTLEDTPVNGNVLTNDTDADGNGIVVTGFVINSVSYAPGTSATLTEGVLVLNANGTFTFTPAPNFNGYVPVVAYSIQDIHGATASSTLTINVTPVDDAPAAMNDTDSVDEDGVLNASVRDNDTESGDGGNTWSVVTGPAHGTLVFYADGSYTYTPNANFHGTDVFTYQVCDADNDCSTATVTITVNPVNDVPVAVNDTESVNEDGILNASVKDNDTESGDGGNTWSVVTGPAHGTLVFNANGTYTYAPNTNFHGTDAFTYQVCDADNDCSTAIVTITVNSVDDAGVVKTKDITVYVDATGNVSITPAQIDNGSYDPDGIYSITLDKTSFDCSDLGANTVILTVTDIYGNPATGTATVTVLDIIKPVISCPAPVTVPCASGVPAVNIASVTANDNCSAVISHVSDVITGQTAPGKYTIVRTYRATDPSGNYSECTQLITVNDNTAPTLIVAGSLPGGGNGQCLAEAPGAPSAASIAALYRDDCSGSVTAVYKNTVTTGSNANGWTVKYYYTVTDASGNSTTACVIYSGKDNIAPVPTVATLPAITAECSVTITRPTAYDNCAGVITATTSSPLTFSTQGTHTVTWTYDDGNGNTHTQTQVVTIKDVKTPVLVGTLPGSNNHQCLSGVPMAPSTTSIAALYTDNCTAVTALLSNTTTTGNNTTGWTVKYFYTVSDGNGNSVQACVTYTGKDNTAPVIACPANATVYCGGSILPSATGTATATDNCGSVTVGYSDVLNGTTITRTWKATDAAGNSSTCTQTITTGGSFTATVASIPTSNVYTGGPANSLFIGYGAQSTKLQVSVPSTGGPYTYTWSGTAVGMLSSTTISNPIFTPTAGNSYTFTVVVKNVYGCTSTAVITICVTDIRVMSSVDDDDDEQTNCDHRSHDYSDCSHRGHNHSCNHRSHSKYDCSHRHEGDDDDDRNCDHRSHSSSDCSHRGHNHASCDHRSHSSSYCDHNKNTNGNSQKVCDHKSHSSNDCNHNSHHHNSCNHSAHNSGNCPHNENGRDDEKKVYICHVPPGNPNNPLTLHISVNAVPHHLANHPGDRLGSCAQQACSPFVDTEKPEIDCPAATTVNYGSSTVPSATGSATASDNSNAVTITYTDASTKGTNAGSAGYYNYTITRTWKATDAAGNSETCTQTITVKDVTKPAISCPSAATVTCSTLVGTANSGSATATDNGGGPVAVTYSDYTSGNTITRTWKAMDVCGNYATCTQIISVVDNIKPVISCPANATVSCGASTLPSYCGNGAYATATDNCDNNIAISYSDVKTGNVITRTWKATDDAGNYSTCTQTITIADNVKPVISCPGNISVSCGSNTTPGGCNSTATATDNCDNNVEVTYSDVINGNLITRTWTATDDAGNTSSCVQKITIVDNTKPVLTEPNDITVSCSASTAPSATGNATATDNCSAVTITFTDVTSGNKITRTWMATDAAGNSITDIQIITISDIVKPVISDVPDVTLNCGGSAAPSATGTATATDNCSAVTISYSDYTSGNEITRTWKATDAAGNYSTSTQKIVTGSAFTPNISSVPSTSTYTGGIATNLYIGYGAQSTKLEVCALPSSGAPYTYTWLGSAISRLSSTSSSAPVFTPATSGSFTFTVSVKNRYGCTYTDYITICVTDIRVAGTNGSKVYVCNTVTSKWGTKSKQTLQVSLSQVASYINSTNCDNDDARLGSCDQTPCNTTAVNTTTVSTKQGMTAEAGETVKLVSTEEELKVTVMPNPSTTFFTLKLESRYETPVNLRVMDGNGRVVDSRSKLGANSTLQIGHSYSSGTYYAELIQGGTRKVVQLIKARG